MQLSDLLNFVESHGLALVLVGVAVIIVMIPAGRKLAELVSAAVAFMEEALELVLTLARGDGNGRASIWDRIDGLEERMEEKLDEGNRRFVDLEGRVAQAADTIESHVAHGARPECDERLRRLEARLGEGGGADG